MASLTHALHAHAHPLSLDDTPGRTRKHRLAVGADNYSPSRTRTDDDVENDTSSSSVRLHAAKPSISVNASALFQEDLQVKSVDVDMSIASQKWHEFTDEDIQAAVEGLDGISIYSVLRNLSSALSTNRAELEEYRRASREQEVAQEKRTTQLLKDLTSTEQEIAKRLLSKIASGDGEDIIPRVRNQHSFIVSNGHSS